MLLAFSATPSADELLGGAAFGVVLVQAVTAALGLGAGVLRSAGVIEGPRTVTFSRRQLTVATVLPIVFALLFWLLIA